MAMVNVGIHDRLNLIAALPWIQTNASGGQMQGARGLQDVGVWAKWQGLKMTKGNGRINGFGVLGFTLPASNYLSDYQPFSLGLGAPEISARATLQYHHQGTGLFCGATGAFHHRGYTQIERDYYYTTQDFYTDWVDVPNALTYGISMGAWLFDNTLRITASFNGMRTQGGFDIRRQDMGFPSNRMNADRLGIDGQYYLPFARQLSILGMCQKVIAGRNVGQSLAYSGGLAWQFGVWK